MLLAALAACGGEDGTQRPELAVAPPLTGIGDAYAAAETVKLAAPHPEDATGLHNLFHLSEHVISGSEPHGDPAFRHLAGLGVRTILSVDGMTPDAETAARYGIQYVHVPIQYKTISRDELLRITKTFREMPGPFYVHCFHGKHRGPAAAAIGRLVLDGTSREQAIAEMRQWCGTSAKYGGLYGVVATAAIPTAEETQAYDFDFASAKPLTGFAAAMVRISRPYDFLEAAAKRGWSGDEEQPDLEPANEARILAEMFRRTQELVDTEMRPEDFQKWMDQSVTESARLAAALAKVKAGEAAGQEEATAAFAALKQRCDSCHAVYRND